MNFATLGYAAFLLVVVGVYWALPRRAGRTWLILASLVFYGSWNPLFVPGFLALIAATWALGFAAAGPHRRLAVAGAIAVNVGVLGLFKYADWLLGSAASVYALVTGSEPAFGPIGLILPMAISFVTFTALAYVIDVSRGVVPPERDLGRYALFIAFFPRLLAGPIMRASEFLPQARHPRPFSMRHLEAAGPLLIAGFLKKTVADNLAPTVALVFSDPAAFSTPSLWMGVLAYSFQVFLDFSGYTDMALGSAALLGFRLPPNFNWPYRATSIQDFWRRWHLSLSRWLRDYVYFPLRGRQPHPARPYGALVITMLVCGVWHGAGLGFILWGACHGVGLAANRWHRRHLAGTVAVPALAGWAATFALVVLSRVFFRSDSIDQAVEVFRLGLSVRLDGDVIPLAVTLLCVGLTVGQWPAIADRVRSLVPERSPRRYLAYGFALAVAVALMPVQTTRFIYLQF